MCDIVDHDCAVCVTIVHRRQRFVSFLPSCIPYFELHGRCFIKGNSLCEEGGTDGRFAIVIKLVLQRHSAATHGSLIVKTLHTLTKRRTRELCGNMISAVQVSLLVGDVNTFPTADSPIQGISVQIGYIKSIRSHDGPSRTSLNCANRAPGRLPVAARPDMTVCLEVW